MISELRRPSVFQGVNSPPREGQGQEAAAAPPFSPNKKGDPRSCVSILRVPQGGAPMAVEATTTYHRKIVDMTQAIGTEEESYASLIAKTGLATDFPIRPILGRVIIRIETTPEKVSEAGIIMTLDSDRGNRKREGLDRVGVVVAFDERFYKSARNASYQEPGNEDGPGAFVQKQNCPDIKIGDRIFFAVSWAGEPLEWEGQQYHVLEGEDAAALVSSGVEVEAVNR